MNEHYFSELRNSNIKLSKEQEYDLILRAQSGDTKARDEVFMANARFVINHVNKIGSGAGMARYKDELIQVGNIGMLEAIKRFDPSKNLKFISYAVFWIRAEISKWMSKNYRTIRIPENISTKFYSGQEDKDNYVQTCSTELIHPDIIEGILTTDNLAYKDDNIVQINHILSMFDPDTIDIIKCRLGIECEAMYFSEIKEHLNLPQTPERLRQIFMKAMSRLKMKYTEEQLTKYFNI